MSLRATFGEARQSDRPRSSRARSSESRDPRLNDARPNGLAGRTVGQASISPPWGFSRDDGYVRLRSLSRGNEGAPQWGP
ncbi:MAG TPA: hypothetical protein VJL27_02510, partial [Patescibacteria group bacterium]|nr:hypothetical protein [Patescibacteria group bacterium]